MKDFFKIVLASALGFLVANIFFSIISIILFFGFMGSMVGNMGKSTFVLKDNSVLHLKLSGTINERVAEDDPFTALLGSNAPSIMGLNDITNAIRKAKDNKSIKGIYIDSRIFTASTATLAEIRDELLRFKESGKFIVAYSDAYTQGGYYLSSVADKIAVNPQGMVDLHGMASTPIFFKEALDKLGIEIQIFKVGTYKSAVEPFILTSMSDANREQVSSYLNDLWSTIGDDMAKSRNINIDEFNGIVNEMPMMQDVVFLETHNLVDTILYETEMKNYIRSLLDIDEDKKIPSAGVSDMKSVKSTKKESSKNHIALLYAVGEINSGTGSSNIQDKYLVNEIEKLRKNENVKAVVLRVNSPGGSAYASEQIWKAISDLKTDKPVVVSMSDVAASGGYYISCNASKIVAQPTTITGSIGIFGMFPNMKKTSEKLGLDVDVVKTHEYGDFGNFARPMRDGEKEILQSYVERGYDLFLTRCAEGRNIPKDSLALYAEGRVWTGKQAKEIGLVDELGDLKKAIEIAADLASIDDYLVYEYPKMRTFIEELLDNKQKDIAAETLKEYLGDHYQILSLVKNIKEQDYVQARLPYNFNVN
ncbi:MAG: signal peptide peptidase SppA [Dysgonamonadaceae bacterium]|nr:signal peptide peptidase SppA [Dysgonamonadaceae bacterium]MDD4728312.1 signal peptide peptidase SppA [Dysgonamonadaceae bacterium]